jgi:hypothetical protein
MRYVRYTLTALAFVAACQETNDPTRAPRSVPAHASADIAGPDCIVTSLADAGPGSLRGKIDAGCPAIEFAEDIGAGAITLTSGELHLTHDVVILGPGADIVAVSGDKKRRVFEVDAGATVIIAQLTIRDGLAADPTGAPPSADNIDDFSGGGVINYGNTTVVDVVFDDNHALDGGAIANMSAATLRVDRTTMTRGDAVAGAALYSVGTARITRSTIAANKSRTVAAVHSGAGHLTMSNSTVSGNVGDAVGGISSRGDLELAYVTVTGHAGRTDPGVEALGSGAIRIFNSIIAGNTGPLARGDCNAASTVAGWHNLLGTQNACTFERSANNILSDDPQLTPLGDNGGPTQTHVPLAGSPAVDAIPSADCALGLDQSGDRLVGGVDQRSGHRPQGAGCDIGAVEYVAPKDQTPPLVTPTVTGTLGANGWYTSNVTVQWAVGDPESGIASSSGCADVTLTQDTNGTTYKCSATNGANLSTESIVTIERDATKPAIGFSGNAGSYTVDQTVAIACSASDLGSGLATNGCANVSKPAYDFELGGNTLSATASDVAGNTASASTSFTVVLTTNGMSALITRVVQGKSEKNLLDRMDNIRDKIEKHSPALDEQIESFLKELDKAQADGDVSAANAAILARLVQKFLP